jgi:hypothetical protein
MSNYRAPAFNPNTRRVEDADFLDDYFGRYVFGIRFADGHTHKQELCGIKHAGVEIERLNTELTFFKAQLTNLNTITITRERHEQYQKAEEELTLEREKSARIEKETIERCANKINQDADYLSNFDRSVIVAAIRAMGEKE